MPYFEKNVTYFEIHVTYNEKIFDPAEKTLKPFVILFLLVICLPNLSHHLIPCSTNIEQRESRRHYPCIEYVGTTWKHHLLV